MQRKKLQSLLLQSQKMETVGTLAGGIAHDLNNQLTPIKGYLDLLLNQTDPANSAHRLLSEASQAADRCAEVVQRLMNFSRSSPQRKTVLSIGLILNELRALLGKFLPATIRVNIDCSKELWPVEGNETDLQTVFMNLSINARDAMADWGELKITAKNIHFESSQSESGHEGPYVQISVKDSGVGMTSQVMSRV